MRYGVLGLFGVLMGWGGAALAQEPGAAQPDGTVGVAEEQQVPRVGDTVLAPAVGAPGAGGSELPSAKRRWYGTPILIVDGAAYVTFMVAASGEGLAPVAVPGVVGYALGGPITHLAHGNWGRAGLSVLTRGSLPLLGAIVAVNSCDWDADDCTSEVVGATVVGMVMATVLDAAFIASEPVIQSAFSVRPTLAASGHHAFLGASGTF